MAIDQNPPAMSTKDPLAAAIDNELPAYRAISPGAVLSLVLGAASVFCFTDLWFLLMAVGAIIIGLLSIRKIRRFGDVLTGANFARTGIALGLVFGLSSVTHAFATDFMINRDAGQFATKYADVIKGEPLNVSLWFQQPVEYRKSKTPDEVVEELKKAKNPSAPDLYLDRSTPIARIKEKLKGAGGHIHFTKIESKALDGLTVYANALVEVDGTPDPDTTEKEQYALFELVKGSGEAGADWMVKDVKFPYKPASSALNIVKKVDDGHGH